MKYPTGGSGQDFVKASAGTHVAICNAIVDVGLQPGNPQFAGVVGKDGKADQRGLPCPTVYLRFEIPAERVQYQKNGVDVEGPVTIWWNGRASMNEKANLRKAANALSGKTLTDQEAELFDIDTTLGNACMIQVAHSDDGKYANVKNFMPLPKGMKPSKAENPLILYNIENDGSYETLPKFLKEKIDGQIYADANAGKPTNPTQAAGGRQTTGNGKPTNSKPAATATSAEDAFADAEGARQNDKADGFVDDSVDDIK